MTKQLSGQNTKQLSSQCFYFSIPGDADNSTYGVISETLRQLKNSEPHYFSTPPSEKQGFRTISYNLTGAATEAAEFSKKLEEYLQNLEQQLRASPCWYGIPFLCHYRSPRLGSCTVTWSDTESSLLPTIFLSNPRKAYTGTSPGVLDDDLMHPPMHMRHGWP
ncbi:hypothetical protein BDV23DRAFT_178641 [Aspergillus alliaceus]|uniref:Uncharacterized protein n=1 Tax=Petromyces alliaceus TaxID=209559 RepID=A0A5N7CNB1_PETAA|nr:uncharacterized protein BDW43DRAFT_308245 [Aspergillus alliaceus]KAB8236568.1 hypothetical protein BDW43DRAFT_308245 [Aspergillus alliaceus]KAE8395595.1 hypothetical protein BDV23DRAFT_178641 [Aspergillus alliaceus]